MYEFVLNFVCKSHIQKFKNNNLCKYFSRPLGKVNSSSSFEKTDTETFQNTSRSKKNMFRNCFWEHYIYKYDLSWSR